MIIYEDRAVITYCWYAKSGGELLAPILQGHWDICGYRKGFPAALCLAAPDCPRFRCLAGLRRGY